MTRQEAASRGGRATLARYGHDHFRTIGRRGYATTLARWFQGDTLAYRRWLAAKGWDALADEMADWELNRRLAAGEQTACVELPVMCEEDLPW